jgi:PAS domain S-box-containing protein
MVPNHRSIFRLFLVRYTPMALLCILISYIIYYEFKETNETLLLNNLKPHHFLDPLELAWITGSILLLLAIGAWHMSTSRFLQILFENRNRDQLKRMQLLLDSTVEGIYGVDTKGLCTLANKACARMLGYNQPKELIGQHMHELMHHTRPDGSPYPMEECRAHQAFETLVESEVDDELFWRKDGSSFPVSYRAVPIFEEDQTVGMVCTFVDISDRLQAEANRSQLNRLLETSLSEIYIFDPATMLFSYVNRGALENLGYNMEEMAEMTPVDIKPEVDQEQFARIIEPLLNGQKERIIFSTLHQRKDGTTYPVEVHLQLAEQSGKRVFLALILDITQRKKLEEQLRHAQKMEAIGHLAGGVAHDFNNILQVISGNAQLLMLQHTPDQLERNFAAEIIKAVERGSALTRGMLAYSRKQPLTLRQTNLNILIIETLILAKKLMTANITITQNLTSTGLIVLADQTLLQQVIFNLMTNARDAMPDGGTISIRTSLVGLDRKFVDQSGFGAAGNYALLQISDTGHGISQEIRDKVFEPFFTTKDIGKGTGLGLAMVYGTLKQHRGYIAFESDPESGTTFSIYIPIDLPETQNPALNSKNVASDS